MKWNFASYLGVGAALAMGTVSSLNLLAQQNGPSGYDKPNTPNVTAPGVGAPGLPGPPGGFPGPHEYFVPVTVQQTGPDGQVVTTTEMRVVRGGNGPQRSPEQQQAIRDAIAKLKSANSSETEKKEAREAVMKYLKEEFERDQKGRREQLERIEEQVSRLRKELAKREESQSKIIELRMQLLDNDAEGLSFPDSFNELQRLSGPDNRYGGQFTPFQPGLQSGPPSIQPSFPRGYQGGEQGPFQPIPPYVVPNGSYQQFQPNPGFTPPGFNNPGNQVPPNNPIGPNSNPKPRKPAKEKPESEENLK